MPAKSKKAKPAGGVETQSFGAEVSRLLEILVHSVYADREVFLRELVSNAADACDRLRYLALSDESLLAGDPDLGIEIVADAEGGRLSVVDNGIGMGRDELVDNLGTIAKSGTRAFMEQADNAGAGAQIGQFGIGFYSAFIVAREVEVASTRAGTSETWVWRSDGTGEFSVEPAPEGGENLPARGTRVTLALRDGLDEFTDPHRLRHIVKTHSDHVPFPVDVIEVKSGARGEPQRANSASALWTRPKASVTAEQYTEFYGSLSGVFDEPALTIHYKAEGRHEYDVLLFVPSRRPLDLFDPARASRVKLYVRRVLITDAADILPGYLRFVRGVVDSADMPLTISRDMLQDNPVAGAIRRAVTNRVLSTLARQAEDEPDAFATLWQEFGPVIKEGLYEDYERRDELLGLARFRSTAGEGLRSLKEYVADLRPNQTSIYYLTGEDAAALGSNPQLEGFRARGIEVLLLTDPVDSFWTQAVMGFDGKPFKSVARGADDLTGVPRLDDSEDKSANAPRPADVASAVAFVKQTLGDAVSDVRISERLVESPSCLVASDAGLDRTLERLLNERQGGAMSAPVLEINPRHPITAALAGAVTGGAKGGAEDTARMLLDYALIADGDSPHDLAAFSSRLQAMMVKALE